MNLPDGRGPITQLLTSALRRSPHTLDLIEPDPDADPITDDDLQLALWTCYELHYRGFDNVDPRWEWNPSLLELRAGLEDRFDHALTGQVTTGDNGGVIPARLAELVAKDDGPSLSHYLQRVATKSQFREFAIHRSIYQLKEADPHTWALPRLQGRAKAALVAIQSDEYGNGSFDQMHSTLFARSMQAMGLNCAYGAYIDRVPAETLATGNLISLFGLHRARRGQLAGHLAAFEMTSSAPNRRYGHAMRRLFGPQTASAFYDVHVTADAMHEQLALHDLCGVLAADEPELANDILFGAAACLHVETLFGQRLLRMWHAGLSSLRPHPLALSTAS